MPSVKEWGMQGVKCKKCKEPATQTYETAYDYEMSQAYCVRYFERICSSCLYWSGWILLNNGQDKVTIDAKL